MQKSKIVAKIRSSPRDKMPGTKSVCYNQRSVYNLHRKYNLLNYNLIIAIKRESFTRNPRVEENSNCCMNVMI